MTRPTPPSEPGKSDPKAERLARALRDNLRRRKAPPPNRPDRDSNRDKDDPATD